MRRDPMMEDWENGERISQERAWADLQQRLEAAERERDAALDSTAPWRLEAAEADNEVSQMVTEPIRVTGATGVTSAYVVTQTLTGGFSQIHVSLENHTAEDKGFTALASSSFGNDWESDEDAVFDSLLKDADQ